MLLSAGAVLGLLMSRRSSLRWPKFAVEEVHRFVTILTGVFLAIHVGAVLLDSVVPFSVGQVLVPFSASYRPFATGLGTVALELLLAVALTNLVRRRIPHRLWRHAHYLTFGVWLAATVHGALAGTDRHDAWFLLLYGGSSAAVAATAAARFAPENPQRVAIGAAAATAGLVLAMIPQAAPASSASPSFSGDLSATVEQQGQLVSVVGTASGTQQVGFRVDLVVAGNQVQQSELQLRYASGASCRGTVDDVGDTGLSGTCGGRSVEASWSLAGSSVSGRLDVA